MVESATHLLQDLDSISKAHISSLKPCITPVPGAPALVGLCGYLHAYNVHNLMHRNKPFKEESMSESNREA